MSVKEQIERDLKTALLSGDRSLVTTLRGIKSVLLNAEIEAGKRETGLDDTAAVNIIRKESKKRQESAQLYKQAGDQARTDVELNELKVLERYLPRQISDDELEQIIDQAISEAADTSPRVMGKIIARTKELANDGADGARIASAVKRKVTSQ